MSFEIDERSTAIIGKNGAGKTTLSKLLKGLLRPTRGEILLNGRNTKDMSVAELAKQVGMVFQNPNDQIFKYLVLDEVLFGPLQIGMDKETAQDYAGKQRIKSMIHKLRGEGRTVITITHDMNFVADNFERAIVFTNGYVLRDDTTKAVFQQKDVLEEAYLEQPDVMKLCYELGYRESFLSIGEFVRSRYV